MSRKSQANMGVRPPTPLAAPGAEAAQGVALAAAARGLRSWLLDRTVPVGGVAVSCRAELAAAGRALRAVKGRRRCVRELFEIRRTMTFRSLASSPGLTGALQEAAWLRMLDDAEVERTKDRTRDRHWPMPIDRTSNLRLTPYASLGALALYDALCMAGNVGSRSPSHAGRADVRGFGRQAAKLLDAATADDLIVVHLLADAGADLAAECADVAAALAVDRGWFRDLVDFLRGGREAARRESARRLAAWAANRLTPMLDGLDPLSPLLSTERGSKPERLQEAVGLLLRRRASPAVEAWLGWRMGLIAAAGGGAAVVGQLSQALEEDGGGSPAVGWAVRVVLEVLASVPRSGAERAYAALSGTGPSLSGLCGLTVFAALVEGTAPFGEERGRAIGRGGGSGNERSPLSEDGVNPSLLAQLELAVARQLRHAMSSGTHGQAFAGRCLAALVRAFVNRGGGGLEQLALTMPAVRLLPLCREWFRVATAAELTPLREELANAHPELSRARRMREAVDVALQRWGARPTA